MMDWSKSDEDPHGIQKLLNTLRQQQDGNAAGAATPSSSVGAASHRSGNGQGKAFVPSDPSLLETVQRSVNRSAVPTNDTATREDLRHVSFAQALPHLTRLAKDETFLKRLLEMKAEQDRMEETLAKEQAGMEPTTPSMAKERAQWSRQALQRWDSLYGRQQEQLQAMGVPCFFVTRDAAQVRRQRRVFDVLAGLLD